MVFRVNTCPRGGTRTDSPHPLIVGMDCGGAPKSGGARNWDDEFARHISTNVQDAISEGSWFLSPARKQYARRASKWQRWRIQKEPQLPRRRRGLRRAG